MSEWLLDEYQFAKEELEYNVRKKRYLFWLHRPVLHTTAGVFQPDFAALSVSSLVNGGKDTYLTVFTLSDNERPRVVSPLVELEAIHHSTRFKNISGSWSIDIWNKKEISLPEQKPQVKGFAKILNARLAAGEIVAWLEKPRFVVPQFTPEYMAIQKDGKFVFYVRRKVDKAAVTWAKSLYPYLHFQWLFRNAETVMESGPTYATEELARVGQELGVA